MFLLVGSTYILFHIVLLNDPREFIYHIATDWPIIVSAMILGIGLMCPWVSVRLFQAKRPDLAVAQKIPKTTHLLYVALLILSVFGVTILGLFILHQDTKDERFFIAIGFLAHTIIISFTIFVISFKNYRLLVNYQDSV